MNENKCFSFFETITHKDVNIHNENFKILFL